MNRRPKIIQAPAPKVRDLVISDVHGNWHLLERLLEKADYKPKEDRLILLGDMVEKGPDSLGTVRKVMQLCEEGDVLMVMGNCDFIAKNVLFSYRLEFLRSILLSRKESLINEMTSEAGMDPVSKSTDMSDFCQEIRRHYLKELCFLNDLPHVIETPDRIYAHAGIEDEETFAEDFRQNMVRLQFGFEDRHFTRPVVTGHMPVSEYCRTIASFNPRFDPKRNIISIDGGNQVKWAGQLNAVAFSKDGSVQTWSADDCLQVKARHTCHPSNPVPFFINWNQGDVQIEKEENGQAYVYSPYLNRHFWIGKSFLSGSKASDYTNYRVPLETGDTVSLLRLEGGKAWIRKNGIFGWADPADLDLSQISAEDLNKLKEEPDPGTLPLPNL